MGKQELRIEENWKEYRLSYNDIANQIVGRLSLKEKISLMSGRLTREEIRSQILNRKKTHYNETPYWAGGLAKENIMPVLFVDGSRGVVCSKGVYTGFPTTVLRGATFDRDLERRIGKAIGDEVILAGGNLFGGCCINLPYHSGWGRAQESYGEDSFLIGEMGSNLVKGVQSTGVIACIKHFAFNSMENNRLNINIKSDLRAEREVFLPQFKKCIEAGAGSVMTAYNSYNGEICGQNKYLISDILKKEWDFDGFVISDFTWGINDTVKAANAGMDVEMPHTYCYGDALYKAVEKGTVALDKIDEAAVRIVRTMLAHGERILKERNEIKKNKNIFKEHIQLALECARKGITLIENNNDTLPLTCKGKGKKIVVLGRLAEEDNQGDWGSSRTYPPYVVNSVEGIWKMLSGAELIVYSGESTGHCKRLAREADAVIIIAGNDYHIEGEHIKADEAVIKNEMYGGDRVNGLHLPKQDIDIISAVAEIRQDTVLVLNGGGAIVMDDIAGMTGAILMQFYPGMEGGTALGEILFGKISPSGRLPFAIPKREENLVDINWETDEQRYGQYHGYTWLDKEGIKPQYDFGHGLSYSTFEYSNFECEAAANGIQVSVVIKNTGKMESYHTALMFVGAPGKEVEREARLLKGFERIYLKPGESTTVKFECLYKELCYYDTIGERMVLEPGKYIIYVEGLTGEIEINEQ